MGKRKDILNGVQFPSFDNFEAYVADTDNAQAFRDTYARMSRVDLACGISEAAESMAELNSGVTLNWHKLARDMRKTGAVIIHSGTSELLVSVYSEHAGERVFKIATHLVSLAGR